MVVVVMVTDPTIPTETIVLVHHIMVDHNHHHTTKQTIPTDTNLMLLGVQVEMVRSIAIEVLEGVKVSLS